MCKCKYKHNRKQRECILDGVRRAGVHSWTGVNTPEGTGTGTGTMSMSCTPSYLLPYLEHTSSSQGSCTKLKFTSPQPCNRISSPDRSHKCIDLAQLV